MVHNPKLSQNIMKWGVASALFLVFKLVKTAGEKVNELMVKQSFKDNYEFIGNRKLGDMVYRLKKSNYIHVDENDSVRLTNRAKMKIVDKVSDASIADKKCRLVSFDIPEIKRTNRNNFRRAIKRMGFRQVQKSLWVSNRNIGDLVEAAAKEYQVTDYVAYFVADRSNIDKYLKKLLEDK